MQYGAMTSRRGTRREIGRMSVAGDQGEAQKAWQEVEKQDKTGVATRGVSRGARRGRERDFHNTNSHALKKHGDRNAVYIPSKPSVTTHHPAQISHVHPTVPT